MFIKELEIEITYNKRKDIFRKIYNNVSIINREREREKERERERKAYIERQRVGN